jgi:hypothetical protein
VTVSWFGPPNQAGFGLSVAPQNQWREDDMGHVSRSGSLLHLETSHVRVSQSDLKTGEGMTAGGARGTIVEVASGSSWRQTGQCHGLCRTLLPLLCRFLCIRPYVHSSLLVFYLGLQLGPWEDRAPCHFFYFHSCFLV